MRTVYARFAIRIVEKTTVDKKKVYFASGLRASLSTMLIFDAALAIRGIVAQSHNSLVKTTKESQTRQRNIARQRGVAVVVRLVALRMRVGDERRRQRGARRRRRCRRNGPIRWRRRNPAARTA